MLFFRGDNELDLDAAASSQFKKVVFVYGMTSPKTANCTERRAAPNAESVALVEQPLPEENAAMMLVFAYVEPQE